MKLLDNDILYLDNHLLIVEKPHLLLTQPTKEVEDSVQTRGSLWIKEHFQKPGNVFLHPVHRLDRVAGGIVVLVRTSKSLSRLNEQIRRGEWEKTYLVRYQGRLPALEGTLCHLLEKGEYRTEVSPRGQEAILHYRQLQEHLAEVKLVTGRYHQIRAQFAAIGCPILGDVKYGAIMPATTNGIDLYHIQVAFKHPITQTLLRIQSKKALYEDLLSSSHCNDTSCHKH